MNEVVRYVYWKSHMSITALLRQPMTLIVMGESGEHKIENEYDILRTMSMNIGT